MCGSRASLDSIVCFVCLLQFGDSQQLRMVRILRSTLMVRVGGGWTALDEFLVKNDPCRGPFEQTVPRVFLLCPVNPTPTPPPCCVSNSQRKDQPEDQGEVPVSYRKLLQGFDCQQV